MELARLYKPEPQAAARPRPSYLELARRYELFRCMPGEVLVEEGAPLSHVLVITSGAVRVFRRGPEGRELLVELSRAPMVCGEVELLQHVPSLTSVAALERVELRMIPAADYMEHLRTHAAAVAEQARRFAARLLLADRVERRLLATVEERTADLLLTLGDLYGEPQGTDLVISSPLTQEMLARSLGVVRRSVNGALASWRRLGLISRRGRRIVVHDRAKLVELAGRLRQLAEPAPQLAQPAPAPAPAVAPPRPPTAAVPPARVAPAMAPQQPPRTPGSGLPPARVAPPQSVRSQAAARSMPLPGRPGVR